jgi:hypothetical protein
MYRHKAVYLYKHIHTYAHMHVYIYPLAAGAARRLTARVSERVRQRAAAARRLPPRPVLRRADRARRQGAYPPLLRVLTGYPPLLRVLARGAAARGVLEGYYGAGNVGVLGVLTSELRVLPQAADDARAIIVATATATAIYANR